MMSSAAWSMPYLVALSCCARSAVWRCPVGLPHNVAVSCEWSTGPALHCSRLSAHLAGHDGSVCLHVLHAIMAQALEALKTREPSCIGRPDMPFFIHEAHDT
jgi:hypothetical protein